MLFASRASSTSSSGSSTILQPTTPVTLLGMVQDRLASSPGARLGQIESRIATPSSRRDAVKDGDGAVPWFVTSATSLSPSSSLKPQGRRSGLDGPANRVRKALLLEAVVSSTSPAGSSLTRSVWFPSLRGLQGTWMQAAEPVSSGPAVTWETVWVRFDREILKDGDGLLPRFSTRTVMLVSLPVSTTRGFSTLRTRSGLGSSVYMWTS